MQYIILVVDSTDRERLSISMEELHKMLGHEELSKAAILVFANKQARSLKLCESENSEQLKFDKTLPQDVKGCMSAAEISKQLNLQSIRKHKWQIQSCCALTGEG